MASKAEPVDAAVIQKTRDTLGEVITKPPLTTKLLSRPPFRYLHDIVTEVIKTTGFLEGLYSAEELNVNNIQDKEQKMKFLQKAVDAVMFTTGESLKVRASKVIAGQECERTNEFLQAMATAILSKLDPSEAVQQVLKGEKPPSDSTGKGERKKPRADKRAPPPEEGAAKEHKTARRSSKAPQEGGGDAGEKDKQQGAEVKKSVSSTEQSQGSLAADRPVRDKSKERRHRERRREKEARGSDLAGQGEGGTEGKEESVGQKEGELPAEGSTGDSLGSVPLRPPSAKGGRKRQPSNEGANPAGEGEGEGVVQQQQPSLQERTVERPARQIDDDGVKEEPGAQVGVTQEEEEDHPSTPPLPPMAIASQMRRPGSSRPAPPRVLRHQMSQEPGASGSGGVVSSGGGAVAHVILDTDKGDEEDDANFITEEVPVVDAMGQLPVTTDDIDRLAVGALARTMIETKERLEGELAAQSKEQGGPRISEAERRKQRELVAKEIEKLQSGIQALCRSTTPLGKIVDYVQEDIEGMQKELEGWRKENADHSEALRREESITEQELQPLKMQLSELEARIQEQNELILSAKVNILQNDEKIQQLLQNMSFTATT